LTVVKTTLIICLLLL